MRREKSYTGYLICSVICFLIFSISFLLMPIKSNEASQELSVVTLVAGLMFWIGLVIGIITQIILSSIRKRWITKNKIKGRVENQPRLGLISFFRNKAATFFDALLILSLLGLIISIATIDANDYMCYVFIALLSFSFCTHCIFNGKNYFFIKNKDNIQKNIKKSKSNATV